MLLLVVHGGEGGMAQASVVYVKDLTGTAYAAVEVRELEELECDGEGISTVKPVLILTIDKL